MILPLLILGIVGYGIIQFFGLILGVLLARNHHKLLKRQANETTTLLSSQPVDLEGWDGATVLEIDEDC